MKNVNIYTFSGTPATRSFAAILRVVRCTKSPIIFPTLVPINCDPTDWTHLYQNDSQVL